MIPVKENVKISDIEQELQQLKASPLEMNKTPACLFTLIIYANEVCRIHAINEMVLKLIEKFPCRIIYIHCNPSNGQDYLKATVSTQNTQTQDSSIVCDQITLNVAGKQGSRIPFVVLPFLIPDLPIYLLWAPDPNQENETLVQLQKYATSIIFDPEATNNLQLFSQKMLELIDKHKIDLIDMNWARISGWRKLIAKVFDTPEKNQQLMQSKLIQIVYNRKPEEKHSHQKIQPIYLQAWLAAQLKWVLCSFTTTQDVTRFTYFNHQNHQVVIDISSQEKPSLPPGAILTIEALSESNYFFSISRKEETPFVKVSISSEETCELPLTLLLPNQQQNFSFIKDLFFGDGNDHYANMLRMISKQEYPI